MFGKELSKREILLGGVILGMFIERGVNKLLAWRTEAARLRLYAENPALRDYYNDAGLHQVSREAKSFRPEVQK